MTLGPENPQEPLNPYTAPRQTPGAHIPAGSDVAQHLGSAQVQGTHPAYAGYPGQPVPGPYPDNQQFQGQQFHPGQFPGAGPGWQQPMLPPRETFASWGQRVGAYLIDTLANWVPSMVLILVGAAAADAPGDMDTATPTTGFMMFLAFAWLFGFAIWNRMIRQGKTGQPLGKKALKIKLIRKDTRQPVGFWRAFPRDFLHNIIHQFFLIGFLWPLWDAERQTLTDKIMSSYVIRL